MRLAVFTNQFPGPVCTFFARDIRGLLEAGIEVDIFPVYPLNQKLWQFVPDILGENILSRKKVHHIDFAKNFHLLRPWPAQSFMEFCRIAAGTTVSAAGLGFDQLLKNTYLLPKTWAWLKQYKNSNNVNAYDHILAYWGNHAATCAYLFHRLLGRPIPLSIFFHASIDLYCNSVFRQQKLLYTDNIITCSEFNRQYIKEQFSDIFRMKSVSLYVHPHGLDLGDYRYDPHGCSHRKIIAVGRLEKQKGYDYLLRAICELKRRGVELEVDLVGDGQQASALRKLASELQITDKVTFRGWLTPSEVKNAMRQATIFVHPSPGLGDGVPNVIKESMAVGTPVIGTVVAGIPELLDNGKCGMLVPPKDVTALANAIEGLLSNNMLRQEYAVLARRNVEERFDLWKNGERFAKFLRQTTEYKTHAYQQKVS